MSLVFSSDPFTKREKQAAFKKSLDDQRRTDQDTFQYRTAGVDSVDNVGTRQQKSPVHSVHGDVGRHIPGLDYSPDMTRPLPGLDYQQQGAVYAPRFEGSTTPREKQPYMSALSEMNGRPLHVRQQQFEKESQYRNLLRDQIEENRRRKEAEKARLEEEKRRELEEIQRLQGRPAPRRQQHAQFQESPDHPLPSPGRLPPTRYPHHRRQNAMPRYDRVGQAAAAHATLPERGSHNLPEHDSLGNGGQWQIHEGAAEHTSLNQRAFGHDSTPYSLPHTREAVPLDGSACEGGRDVRGYGRAGGVSSRHDGYTQSHSSDVTGRPSGQQPMGQPAGEEDMSTKLALEQGAQVGRDDVVSRTDFDELSNLCRDLLLERKELRRKLEEREEEERLTERGHQQDREKKQQQQQQQNGQLHRKPLRGVAGPKAAIAVSASGGGRRRPPQLPVLSSSREQDGRGAAQESGFRRDSKAKAKPDVAFGSTVSRMGEPRKMETPLSRTGSSQGYRSGRHGRATKSEPVPKADGLGVRHHINRRALASTSDVAHGKLQANPGISKPDRTKGADGTLSECTPQDEGKRATRSRWRSDVEGGGTIHGLLGSIDGRSRISSRDTGEVDSRGGYDELGGESTFLAPHPLDSGIAQGDPQRGRRGAFVDPRAAANLWSGRG